MLTQQFKLGLVVPKMEPDCFSANAAQHKLVPFVNQGWRNWEWQEKVCNADDLVLTSRNT